MKAIGNFIKGTLVTIWAVVAIFTTVCLLTFNKYEVSEFGDYSVLVIDNRSLEPTYQKNDIVIVRKDVQENYNIGDQTFFYYGNKKITSFVNLGEITDVQRNELAQDAYDFSGVKVAYDKIIGKANGSVVIHKWGLVLKALESRFGFAICIILPTIYAVVYEIYVIAKQVKKETAREIERENKNNE